MDFNYVELHSCKSNWVFIVKEQSLKFYSNYCEFWCVSGTIIIAEENNVGVCEVAEGPFLLEYFTQSYQLCSIVY